jgi:transposase InsO family protein
MAQRKAKHSRRQAISRRRWKDLQDAKHQKYTGPWKRRDRRRAAFQTMKARFRIVQQYRHLCDSGMKNGEAAEQTAKAHGISASTVRNYERFVRQEGRRGLLPEFREHETPPRTPWKVIQIILMFRRLLHWGGDRIARELDSREIYTISGQGVYTLFKRYRVYTRTYHPVGKRIGIAYKRLTVTRPNEVWHLDFAGPFVTEKQHKCWVLVVVDAYSRFLISLQVVDSLETITVIAHLAQAFRDYGTPTRLVTDNAPTFRSMWEADDHRFTTWLATRGVDHQHIPPHYPEANGKAEAAVKIVKREAITPFVASYPSWFSEGMQWMLDRFRDYYNFDRLHGGIQWQTPSERYAGFSDRPHGLEHLFFMPEDPILEFQFC